MNSRLFIVLEWEVTIKIYHIKCLYQFTAKALKVIILKDELNIFVLQSKLSVLK